MKNNLLSRGRLAAYTLFEIMLVLAIISVLISAAIFMVGDTSEVAKIKRVDADFQTIVTQLKAYHMLNYNYPTTSQGLQALVTRPTTDPKPKRWVEFMKAVPNDPWQRPYQYDIPAKKTSGEYDLYSFGPDGKSGTEDDLYYE